MTNATDRDIVHVAFKIAYNDGLQACLTGIDPDKHFGYCGICSPELMHENVNGRAAGTSWCKRSGCAQVVRGMLSHHDLIAAMFGEDYQFPCQESQLFLNWSFSPGYYGDGRPHRLKAISNGTLVPRRSFAVFTTREPGVPERERMVVGMYLIDTVSYGANEYYRHHDGTIMARRETWEYYLQQSRPGTGNGGIGRVRPKNIDDFPSEAELAWLPENVQARENVLRLRFSRATAHKVRWWDHYSNPGNPSSTRWGTQVRYPDTSTILSILAAAGQASSDPQEKELITRAEAFLRGEIGFEDVYDPARPPEQEAFKERIEAMHFRGMDPLEEDPEEPFTITGGFGGEGPLHRALKEYVADHPNEIGVPSYMVMTVHLDSYHLRTGSDRPDIVFELTDGPRVAVEIETYHPAAGAYQALKYWVLLNAEHMRAPLDPDLVRVVLVFCEGAPIRERQQAIEICEHYGIDWYELPKESCESLDQ